MEDLITKIQGIVENNALTTNQILINLFFIAIFSLYEFIVYRMVSKKALYNKSFHITTMVVPFFIGSIIKTLQSNLIVSLGTIGALAIIRFRTAVKDPLDMVYILWSVFIGISCGCDLFELCFLTSIVVTIVLIFIDLLNRYLIKKPFILVINAIDEIEKEITSIVKTYSKSYRLKSRNYSSTSFDYVYEISTKKPNELVDRLRTISNISRFSLLEFDSEDII